MAARPLWSGQLRLSLVSMAVDLYSATRSGARISFRQIHEPSGKRIRYENEIRKADPLFAGVGDEKVQEELLDVATALIEKKTAPFDARAFKDNYTVAMRELIERKRQSKTSKKIVEEEKEAPPSTEDNVIDLMSALKRSLEGTSGGKKKKTGKKKASGTRRKSTSRKKKRA